MDRNVAVSFSTTTWDDVARGLRETIASLESSSPEVTHWAKEASAGKAVSRELVDKVVTASGDVVKEANGIILADVDLGRVSRADARCPSDGLCASREARPHDFARGGLPIDHSVSPSHRTDGRGAAFVP